MKALHMYLGAMLPGLTVLDAKVDWFNGIPEQDTDLVKLIVIISALLLSLGLASYVVWKCRATGVVCCSTQKEHVQAKGTDVIAGVDVEKASKKIGKDEIDDTASTATPDSEQQASEDSSSSKQGDESSAIILEL